MIDWTDVTCQVTEHFSVGECLTLHEWNRLANEQDGVTDEVKANIVSLCQIMEQIRGILDCLINTHCIFRSVQYNEQVLHSLPNDVHALGMAIDFDCGDAHTIQEVKDILEPLLEQYGIRMERGTSTWIHLDIHPVGPSGRSFTA